MVNRRASVCSLEPHRCRGAHSWQEQRGYKTTECPYCRMIQFLSTSQSIAYPGLRPILLFPPTLLGSLSVPLGLGWGREEWGQCQDKWLLSAGSFLRMGRKISLPRFSKSGQSSGQLEAGFPQTSQHQSACMVPPN